jgi:hypothetical protein
LAGSLAQSTLMLQGRVRKATRHFVRDEEAAGSNPASPTTVGPCGVRTQFDCRRESATKTAGGAPWQDHGAKGSHPASPTTLTHREKGLSRKKHESEFRRSCGWSCGVAPGRLVARGARRETPITGMGHQLQRRRKNRGANRPRYWSTPHRLGDCFPNVRKRRRVVEHDPAVVSCDAEP